MASVVNGTVLAASTTTALVQAFQEGSLGVSFGIAGESHLHYYAP